ncbi:MAG: O-antigen ligase family protein [Patescibacteria group bacterium]
MQKIIDKFFKTEKYNFVIIASLLFYLSLFFSLNNKILLVIFIIFIFIFYKRFKSWPLTLFILYILFLPFQKGKGIELVLIPNWILNYWGLNINSPYSFTSSITFSDISFAGIFLLLLVSEIKNKTKKIFSKIDLIYLLLFGFLIFNFIPIIGSYYPFVSLVAYLKILRYVAICFLMPLLFKDKKIKSYIPILFSSSVLFQGFWATIQFALKRPLGLAIEPINYFFSPYGFSASEQNTFFRSTGTFDHPNTLGVFLVILLIFLIIKLPNLLKITKNKLFIISTFVFGILGLIFSASRASWVVFTIVFLIIIFYFYKANILKKYIHLIPKKSIFTLTALLAAFFPIIILPRLNQLYITFFTKDQGLYYRYYLLEKAWNLSLKYPLGIGLGTFPAYLLRTFGFTAWPTPVHNIFLEISVESGFISLLFFILIIITLVKKYLKKIHKIKSNVFSLETGAIFAIFAFLLLAQFYPFYLSGRIIEYFWLFIGIII